MRVAPHRDARDAERQPGTQLLQSLRGARAARRGIAEDADVEAARDLGPGDVDDVPEEPADGSAEDVQDARAFKTTAP
jgi:hypothetical protein